MAACAHMPHPNTNITAIADVREAYANKTRPGSVTIPQPGSFPSRLVLNPENKTTGPIQHGKTLQSSWREIQGSNDWHSLLEPLHPLLRNEIVRYGEFIAACYTAFNFNPDSKRYLHCKYARKDMLQQAGMGTAGYEVTRYIYASPGLDIPIDNGITCSRWLGYVAVSPNANKFGRRDIAVVFRGTVTNQEWIVNFMSSLTPANLDPLNGREDIKVESGFLNLYTSEDGTGKFGTKSCREQLLSEISRLVNKHKGEEMSITIAGHSMGSSIALLLAYDIAELGLNQHSSIHRRIPITVYSFGGPRVGNLGFKKRCEQLGIKVLRIVNNNDPVTKLPGIIFNEKLQLFGGKYEVPWRNSCYTHVGVELAFNFFDMYNPSSVHDLDAYVSFLKFPRKLKMQKVRNESADKAWNALLSMVKLETWQRIKHVI